MLLPFIKMHGLGNDFIIIDATTKKIKLTAQQIRLLADRHYGVGCDQLLMIEPSKQPEADFYYRIFNADGSEVFQCGNGSRCIAWYLFDSGKHSAKEVVLATKTRLLRARKVGKQISVDMGIPLFKPEQIPMQADHDNVIDFTFEKKKFELIGVNMGNPHAVICVKNLANIALSALGKMWTAHSRFPEQTNVDIFQIRGREQIELWVYERGVGETLACGSGACAAAVIGMKRGWLDNAVMVHQRGGSLKIQWLGDGQAVWMTGPAQKVFVGEYIL